MIFLKIFFALLIFSSHSAIADIWVVTNSENTESLNFDEVQKVFRADRQQWANGKKIVLVLPGDGTEESNILLSKVFDLSQRKFKKFWLEKVYRGDIPGFPEKKSGESMKLFIKSYPHSIGVLSGSFIDGSIKKVIKLD